MARETAGDSPRIWIRPHYASFNGIRGLAVTMVFFCHYGGGGIGQTLAENTLWVGVDLFFVLSGFLITGILYDSLHNPRYFRDFYVRRALRIFPVFYGFFLALLIITPLLHLHYHLDIIAYVFYVGNLVFPFVDLARHDPSMISAVIHGHSMDVGNISHLWSLCVEEQFYLVWPVVVWWVRDRRRLMCVCVLVSALTLFGRFYLYAHASPVAINHYLIYSSTYTRCDTLLAGAFLALYLRGNPLSRTQLQQASGMLFFVPIAALAIGTCIWPNDGFFRGPFTVTVGFSLIALACAGVVFGALDDEYWIARLLRNRPLSALGTISYGVYFYHAIPADLWKHFNGLHPALTNLIPLIAFVATVAFAWLSFQLLERPFLRLKGVLAPQRDHIHVSEPRPSFCNSSPVAASKTRSHESSVSGGEIR